MSEELDKSREILEQFGFKQTAKFFDSLASGYHNCWVVVHQHSREGDEFVSFQEDGAKVFFDSKVAENASMEFTADYIRNNLLSDFYWEIPKLMYRTQEAMDQLGPQICEILDDYHELSQDDYLVPKTATNEQIIQVCELLKFNPFVAKKVTISVKGI